MGKAFAVFVVVAVFGVVVLFFAGGLGSFDPAAEAEQFTKAVKPGMTWQQVLTLSEPGKWMVPNFDVPSGTSPAQKFDRPKFEKALNDTGLPIGFIWQYAFTSEQTYQVWFSVDGKVEQVVRQHSMGDLLHGKLPGQ